MLLAGTTIQAGFTNKRNMLIPTQVKASKVNGNMMASKKNSLPNTKEGYKQFTMSENIQWTYTVQIRKPLWTPYPTEGQSTENLYGQEA